MMTEDRPYAGILMKDGTELTHYGVKGMKWGKRLFGKVKGIFGKPPTKNTDPDRAIDAYFKGKDKNPSGKSNNKKSGRVKTKTYTTYDSDRRPIDKETVTYTNADKGKIQNPTSRKNVVANAINKRKKWY